MFGLSVKASVAPEIREMLDEQGLLLDGQMAKLTPVLERFDRAIFPVKDDTGLVALAFQIDHETAAPQQLPDDIIKTAIKAAKPKGYFSRRAAVYARQRYYDILGKVIDNPFSCYAHVAWVTRKEWDGYEKLGLWTHDWRVEYVFNGATYSQTGCAVCVERARRDVLKFVRALAKTHRGASIRLARAVDRKSKRGSDFTRAAGNTMERANKRR